MFFVWTWAIVFCLIELYLCAYLITNKSLVDFEEIVFGKLDAVERNANSRYGEKGKDQSLQRACPEALVSGN